MAKPTTREERKRIRAWLKDDALFAKTCDFYWARFDADGNQQLSQREAAAMITELADKSGVDPPTFAVLAELWQFGDLNADGAIDRAEFAAYLRRVIKVLVRAAREAVVAAGDSSSSWFAAAADDVGDEGDAGLKEDKADDESEESDASDIDGDDVGDGNLEVWEYRGTAGRFNSSVVFGTCECLLALCVCVFASCVFV
jgi:hypothetical protein